MNDGHCPKCGALFTLLQDMGIVQKWQCSGCQKVVYKPFNKMEIYQTLDEARQAIK